MTEYADVIHYPEKSPMILSTKTMPRRLQTRGRIRNSSLTRFGADLRMVNAPSSARRSAPVTPLLSWNFQDEDRSRKSTMEAGGNTTPKAKGSLTRKKAAVSARKLAAGIWHLKLREITRSRGYGKEAAGASLGFEPAHACNDNNANHHFGLMNGFSSYVPLQKLASALPNHAMEKATKWDSEMFSQLNLLDGQQVPTASIISSLQAELEGAQSRIHELEEELRSGKKKLDRFMRKAAEEKESWRAREHDKVRVLIDSLKSDLSRERKYRHRSEIVNSKLVNELAEAKLSAKRLLQDCEKERKGRELVEDVCNELAAEMGENKAEIEALKRNSAKIREEVEEERRMLQMAEVWREERVQMKLLDAKLALEDKHSKLSRLQAELEAFLRSPDKAHIRQAELLKDAIDSVNAEEAMEFTYRPPPASEGIFSVFEELEPKDERDMEPCYAYSPASHDSNTHSVSPATDVFLEKPIRRRRYSDGDTEEDSDWETLSPGEGQDLSEQSVDSSNGNACEVKSEPGEVYSLMNRESKKGASVIRLWRLNNGEEELKKSSMGLTKGRLSDGRVGEVGLSPLRADLLSSPDSVNPHIGRGMKGCIDWPRASQKHSLKAKLLEARMENHKTQLRHVLKQKI